MRPTDPPLRFRHSPALAVAAVIMVLAGFSLGAWAPWALMLLLIPAGVAVWAWRAGTDVDAGGVTVRALLGGRRIGWGEITGFSADARGRVSARLRSGSAIELTAVAAPDLPRVVARSGHDLVPVAPTGR